MSTEYRHSQPGWVLIVTSVILAGAGVAVKILAKGPPEIIAYWLALIGVVIFVFGYRMAVEVKDAFLTFCFGAGIFRKKIAIGDIAYCEPFKGVVCGWGIHTTGDGWLYNVSGMKAVTIVLKSGKKMHIGTDEPHQLIEAVNSAVRGLAPDDASVMWSEVKADYLKRIEQVLSQARHPRSFEILADVAGHLEKRFAELGSQQRTWENFQQIITEMGPPADYGELVQQNERRGKFRLTRTEWLAVALLLAGFCTGAYFYPQMPERMACHWDFQGRVNGYVPKALGLFMMPGILAVLVLLVLVVPRIGSVAANIEAFRRFYGALAVLTGIFLLAVQYHIILWNLGIKVNPLWVVLMPLPAIAVWAIIHYRRKCRTG